MEVTTNFALFKGDWQYLPLSIQQIVRDILINRPSISDILKNEELFENNLPYHILHDYHSKWYALEADETVNKTFMWLERATLANMYIPMLLAYSSTVVRGGESLDVTFLKLNLITI